MKRNQLLIALAISSLTACGSPDAETNSTPAKGLVSEVMTKEKQQAMSIDDVMLDLREGNERFINSELTQRDHRAQLKQLLHGQYPKAVILSCIDSRVPVEEVFDQGMGDLFVARVAGNVESKNIVASLEYSCKVAGSKVIIVVGHEYCGAVKSAIREVELGNITNLLAHIQPAISNHADFSGEKKASNHDFVEVVTKENVLLTLEAIRERSPILKKMESSGKVKLVGAYFDLEVGKITLLEKE